jgi:hypothetical protein
VISANFSFWAIVAYLLPGLVMVQARALAARSEFESIAKESLITYAIFTVLYDLFLWAIGFALQTESSISSVKPSLLIAYIILIPGAIGFCYGLAERHWIIQRLLTPFGINAPLPMKGVWLEIFSRQAVGTYMIVTLKDGTMFNAMATDDSRFGSNASSPDLYLGQIYSVPDWEPANPRRGVYISGDEIRSIEIINPQ